MAINYGKKLWMWQKIVNVAKNYVLSRLCTNTQKIHDFDLSNIIVVIIEPITGSIQQTFSQG